MNEIGLISSESYKDCFHSFDLAASKLDPNVLMGQRKYDRNLYFSHPVFDEIKRRITEDRLIFIIGNPLSGKTRIVYDALSGLNEGILLIPKLDISIREYIQPGIKNSIIVIDNLDDYCRSTISVFAINKLLTYVLTSRIKCIVTCRVGPLEYGFIRKSLNHQTFEALDEFQIRIPRFDKVDSKLKEFLALNSYQIKSPASFDGNIGSMILPLTQMKFRFLDLVENKAELQLAILIGLKLHYHLYNFENRKSCYNDSKIFLFCKRYLGVPIYLNDWETAKRALSTGVESLNFIDAQDLIVIEEAYLEFLMNDQRESIDVIDSTLGRKQLLTLYNRIYKTIDEKKAAGFPITIGDYNTIIEKVDLASGTKILNSLPEGIRPNPATYSLLMKKTNDHGILETLYSDAKYKGVREKFLPQHSFIGTFSSFKDLFLSIEKLDSRSLERRNSTSNRLILLASKKPKESLEFLFQKFTPKQVYSNPVYSEICLKCCTDVDDFALYVEPHIGQIEKLDYPLKKNFIRICLKLKRQKIALDLIEAYLASNVFDYNNEKANCLKETAPYKALHLYNTAIVNSTNIKEQLKACTNFLSLVYEKNLSDRVDDALLLTKKFDFSDPLLLKLTKHFRQNIVLLEIWQTPLDTLNKKIIALIAKPGMKKQLLSIKGRINDVDKRGIIDLFFAKS